MKVSYEEWCDELLRLWPDAQIARGYPIVCARFRGIVVGEWSHRGAFWIKTPHYESARLDAQQEQIWEQTLSGLGTQASIQRA